MTDWIWHNGGPQPVADDVWVEISTPPENQVQPAAKFNWKASLFYFRILNKRMIDAALKRGIELGLKAAIEYTDNVAEEALDFEGNEVNAFIYQRHARGLRDLNPETIAKENDQ